MTNEPSKNLKGKYYYQSLVMENAIKDQNPWDIAKVVLSRNVYIIKQKDVKKQPNLLNKDLGKQEQTTPKICRRNDIKNNRVEIIQKLNVLKLKN